MLCFMFFLYFFFYFIWLIIFIFHGVWVLPPKPSICWLLLCCYRRGASEFWSRLFGALFRDLPLGSLLPTRTQTHTHTYKGFEFDLPIAVCSAKSFRFRQQFYIFVKKKKINKILPTRALKLVTKLSWRGWFSGERVHIFGYSNQTSIKKKNTKNKQLERKVAEFRSRGKCFETRMNWGILQAPQVFWTFLQVFWLPRVDSTHF